MTIRLISPYTSRAYAYKGQLHCHTTNSDGGDAPAVTVAAYKALGYHFISVTDHDFVTPDPGVAGILYIPGCEESDGQQNGHVGRVPAITDAAAPEQSSIDVGISEGSFITLCHPNWPGGGQSWPLSEVAAVTGYHAIEIWNSHCENDLGATGLAENVADAVLSAGYPVWLVGSDDNHSVANINSTGKGFVVVFADALTQADIIAALKAGNFYASSGAAITSVTVSGAVLTVITDAASTIEFITRGGAVAKTEASVTTSSYTATGAERYIRIKVTRDSDGLIAWSNPVYVEVSVGGGATMFNINRIKADRSIEEEQYILSTRPTFYLPLWKKDWQGTNQLLSSDGHGFVADVGGPIRCQQGAIFTAALNHNINFGDDTLLDIIGEITLDVWFKALAPISAEGFLMGRDSAIGRNYYLLTDNLGNATFTIWIANAFKQFTFTPGTYHTDLAWHHLQGVYDGSSLCGDLDGRPVGTPVAAAGAIDNDDVNFTIGMRTGGRPFNGVIGHGIVWPRARSREERQRDHIMTEWRYR